MKTPRLPWARILGEGALIIVSVYLAIFLESVSQDRQSRLSANLALVQMLAEMKEDAADVAEIRKVQLERSEQYALLQVHSQCRWMQ